MTQRERMEPAKIPLKERASKMLGLVGDLVTKVITLRPFRQTLHRSLTQDEKTNWVKREDGIEFWG